MQIDRFQIAERFRGPPRSGNGGYVCGRIAKHLSGTVSARLKAPPPLDTEVRLESSAGYARLFDGDILIGEARTSVLEMQVPSPPSYGQAQEASASFLGFKTHTFPGCFVCGPAREPMDGLRIFPGQVAGTPTIAAPWTPDRSLADEAGILRSEFLWSALDCTGGFAVLPLPEGLAIVLGELCTSIVGTIQVGERCVVTGWPLGTEGRKRFAGSAVYNARSQLIAQARAVWFEVPLSTWE
jgi:hypothetical protein